MPDELQGPPMPAGVDALWQAYAELSAARAGGGFGVSPVSHRDLVSYQELYGVRFTPWEVDLLLKLDRAVIGAATSDKD